MGSEMCIRDSPPPVQHHVPQFLLRNFCAGATTDRKEAPLAHCWEDVMNVARVAMLALVLAANARGFNLYDGSLRDATFASIKTTGDGSVWDPEPLGRLAIDIL